MTRPSVQIISPKTSFRNSNETVKIFSFPAVGQSGFGSFAASFFRPSKVQFQLAGGSFSSRGSSDSGLPRQAGGARSRRLKAQLENLLQKPEFMKDRTSIEYTEEERVEIL